MARAKVFVVAIVVASFASGSPGSAQTPANDKPQSQEKPLVLVVKQLRVAKTKASKEAWDIFNGKPDPQIIIQRREPVLEKKVEELEQVRNQRREQLRQAEAKRLQQEIDPLSADEQKRRRREWERKRSERDKLLEKDPAIRELTRQLDELRSRYIFVTLVAENTFEFNFNTETRPIAVGDTVRVTVRDVDLSFHDLIGETELEITPRLARDGRLALRFGQVEYLELEIRPRRP